MIKKLGKTVLLRLLGIMGYEAAFFNKGMGNAIVVDKNIWEPYYQHDRNMELYFEGLERSGSDDNYYKQLRFYSLQEMVNYVLRQGLKGDFVECGVWQGHSAYVISKLLSENSHEAGFHIFDSFEGGLSSKVDADKNIRREMTEEENIEESRVFSSTEEQVQSCLNDFDFIKLYKGWIPDRFDEVEDKTFAFVHIDVDLYEPTRDSLSFFYPRLVENGVIVCDDYGSSQFPGAKKAVDDFLKENDFKVFYKVPMGACFIIK